MMALESLWDWINAPPSSAPKKLKKSFVSSANGDEDDEPKKQVDKDKKEKSGKREKIE